MGAPSTIVQSDSLPLPCATVSMTVAPVPPHSISEQKGRWQLPPATGDAGQKEKASERGGKNKLILLYQVLR